MRHETPSIIRSRSRRGNAARSQARHLTFGLILLFCSALGGIAELHAEEPKSQPQALMDQIWMPLPPLKRVLSKQDQEYAEVALIQWVETYLRGEYEVIDQEFFWKNRKLSGWAAIGSGYASSISGEGSKWRGLEIDETWYRSALDPIRLWKVSIDGRDHYFAVAATKKPVPGTRRHRLIGRFELEKVIE